MLEERELGRPRRFSKKARDEAKMAAPTTLLLVAVVILGNVEMHTSSSHSVLIRPCALVPCLRHALEEPRLGHRWLGNACELGREPQRLRGGFDVWGDDDDDDQAGAALEAEAPRGEDIHTHLNLRVVSERSPGGRSLEKNKQLI